MEQSHTTRLNSGIPLIESYNYLLKCPLFHEMEKYSDFFLILNADSLINYRKKWVSDPFHSWSRQWEYPFVYQKIQNYINNNMDLNGLKILDAGSGVTFFPYYINSIFEEVEMNCCDFDEEHGSIYSNINAKIEQNVKFHNMNINDLKFENNYFDIIYCISVLEHTNCYETILEEFNRVLKPDGLLILTFDVSIDGFLDIPIDKARELISLLEKYFIPTENLNSYDSLDNLDKFNLVLTTDYIKKLNKSLLPWNYSMLSRIIQKFRSRNPNLTIYCNEYRKRTE